jgi:hypothetical protein
MAEYSPEFRAVVHMLRALPSRDRHMALFAAEFWSEERIEEMELAACTGRGEAPIELPANVISLAARRNS